MRVDIIDAATAVQLIVQKCVAGQAGYCCVPNVHVCMLTRDDPEFRAIINEADLVLPDSTVLRKAVALRYRRDVPPFLRGAELMLELCKEAARAGVAIGLVGGRSEDVLQRLIDILTKHFPELSIAYAYSPPFHPVSTEDTEQALRKLRDSGARLVFVGLGCPKQERWMAAHTSKVDAFLIGVGAAFDFNAGVVRPSPSWVHEAGIEWLYRLAMEPRRLWRRYLTTSPKFIVAMASELVRDRH